MNALHCVLADLGLERNPYAERGLVALACIACGLGLISMVRWWLHPPSNSVAGDDAERGWPFMKRTLRAVTQLGGGALFVLLLSNLMIGAPARPAGWSLISPPHEVYALALQGDLVWAGGKEGLFGIDRTSGVPVDSPLHSRDLRGVRALLVEGDSLWIGCTGGLFRWDGHELKRMAPSSLPDTGPISALRRTSGGDLWVGAMGGAWCLSADRWQWFGEAEGLRLPTVDSIFEDQRGTLWFASKEPESPGLWRRDGGKWSLLGPPDGLKHTAVNDLMEDHRGVLWIACGFGSAGLAQTIVDGKVSAAQAVKGLEGKKIRSLFEDRSRRLWFCSEYDGVAIRDGDVWQRLTLREGLPGNEIKVMLEDAQGTLWLGNERGLGRICGKH